MNILTQYEKYKIKTIIQCGDIHWRLLRRHDEYKEVFDRFYEDLKKYDNKRTLLILTGDILHSKTELSPELINVVSQFFTQLSNILPTIIIAGNHDFSVSNANRLDSLTPIVDNLNLNNFHYFKNSDIYKVGNIDIALYSIMDDKNHWPTISDCSNERNIALYHGPVSGGTNPFKFEIKSDVDISLWDGFDAVLLGDIHTGCCLQKYDKLKKLPEIIYPGSFLQQNHAESINNHGYVIWNMQDISHEFMHVPNDYGYATLIYGKDDVEKVLEFPKNLRLRILTEISESAEFKEYVAKIKSKRNILELTIIKNFEEKTISKTTDAVLNIRDVDYQNKLLTEYINNPKLIERICNINKITNSKLKLEQFPKNTIWKPILMEFDNLFSYGEGNSIDFTELDGLIGIVGENQIGKTSIFNALCFALFDKTPTAYRNHHILNTRKNSGYVRLIFSIGVDKYEIERKLTRKKEGEVKIEVNFYKINEGRISLNGLEKRLTDNIICQYVGSYDDFILTTLNVQNQNSAFIDKGQSERKDLLSQFLGLTIFDKLYDIANEEKKIMSAEIKFLNIDDLYIKKTSHEKSIETINKQLLILDAEIINKSRDIKKNKTEIEELYINIIPLDILISWHDIGLLQDDKKTYTNQIIQYESKLKQHEDKLIEIDNNINTINEELKNVFISHDDYIKYNELEKAIILKNSELSNIEKDIKNKEKKLEQLAQHKYDPNCSYCINNIFVKDAIQTKAQLQTIIIEKKLIDENLNILQNELTLSGDVKTLYGNQEKLQNTLKDIEKNRVVIINNIEILKQKILSSNTELQETIKQMELYEEYKSAIKRNTELLDTIEIHKALEITLTDEVSAYQIKHTTYNQELIQTQTLLDTINNNITQYSIKEEELEAYEVYLSSISRDGIPYKLIENILPVLENKINEILISTANFSIQLQTDGKNINANLLHRNSKWPLELASGLEKFISGLAIRTGLISISNLPRSNHIIIDEGFGVMDSSYIATIEQFMQQLLYSFETIFVISHLDSIRELTDNRVEITIDKDGFSKVLI